MNVVEQKTFDDFVDEVDDNFREIDDNFDKKVELIMAKVFKEMAKGCHIGHMAAVFTNMAKELEQRNA